MRTLLIRALLVPAVLLACAASAAFVPDQQYTNWLANYRNQLRSQTPKLATNEIEALAMTLARSNRLAEIIPEMLFNKEPDFEAAAELLKEFPGGANALTRYGQSMLYSAISENRVNTLEFLLQHKADPNATLYNQPALVHAIENNRWDMALMLIKAGASPNARNSGGQTAANLFFERWYPGSGRTLPDELVPLLLATGLDFYAPSRSGNDSSTIEMCLQREQGYRYGSGYAQNSFFSELLLTNNASPALRTPRGDTALHLAVHYQYTNSIALLLARGFSINQTNNAGLTPLQDLVSAGKGNIPASTGTPQVSGLRRGVTPNAPAPPTVVAVNTNPPAVPQSLAGYLLDHGATLDIFSAAGLGLTNEVASMLATNPALARACDSYGRTPMHYALLNSASFAGSIYYGGFRGNMIWNGPFPPQGFSMRGGWGVPSPANGGAPVPSNGVPLVVALLLKAGADPSAATTSEVPNRNFAPNLVAKTTPLHLAARNGDTPVIRALLAARARVELADLNGDTPLHLASRTWQTNVLTLLLNARAPIEALNRNNQSSLRTAVESGVTPAVVALLDAGANRTNGLGTNTLLHLAVVRNDCNTAKLLLDRQFALESRDGAGNTPLQVAVMARAFDAVKLLRERGADINATNFAGESALHLLARQQEDNVYHAPEDSAFTEWERKQLGTRTWIGRGLGWLIQSKILSPVPPQRWTNSSLSVWLIERGAKAGVTNRAGQTPLHLLCSADWMRWFYGYQSTNRFAALLDAGIRLDQPDTNGMTPLHIAATNASPQFFKLLLAKAGPAAVNQPDGQGRTMLHRAVEGARDNFEGVKTLLESGANVNAQDKDGFTPLRVLVALPPDGWMYRRRELAMMLLTNKADPNLADKQGRTPVAVALSRLSNHNEWNQREIITTLLTNGANPNLADREGNTAVHEYFLAATNNYNRFSMRDAMHAALKARADYSLTNRVGVTPLQLLASKNEPYSHPLHYMTDFIDATNAAFTVRNSDGNTALHLFALNAPDCSQCGDTLGRLLAIEGRSALTNLSGKTPLDLLSENPSRRWLSARVISGAGINLKSLASPDRTGQPLLHRMIQSLPQNSYETQQFLRRALTNKSLLNLTNAAGDTPLHIALRQRDSFMARQLVEAGADLRLKNTNGETPVRLAAINFPSGPTFVNPPDIRLPFFVAARSRNSNGDIDRWLEYDPGLATITNYQGVTAVMAASEAGNTRLVNDLIRFGGKLDALSALRLGRMEEFRTLLPLASRPIPPGWVFEAVRFDRLEGLQSLAAAGCDVKAADADGHSLLFRARAAKQDATAEWLTAQGCRETLFDFIANDDRAAVAAALDANKALLEEPNRRGRPAIVAAVAAQKPEMVAALIERGAKVDAKIDGEWSLLHIAAANDSLEVARLLLKAGVASNGVTSNSQLSPLAVAAIYGSTNVAELLIQNGASVNAQPESGFRNTPLHWAAHLGQAGMIRLLLAHGADRDLKNNRSGGETPLYLARLPSNSVGMGFNSPPEAGQYPRRSLSAEERAELVKLLEGAFGQK